ncbi:MAG: glycosyltransferase family 2 protein [Planctomycetota bacterium]
MPTTTETADSSPSGTWVAVVNYDGGEANLACVASVLAAGVPPEHVVFVDNASSDGSLELVEREHPGLVFVRNSDNRGFGCAADQAIAIALAAGATEVFLLNNDATVEPGCLEGLVERLRASDDVGVCGPLVVRAGADRTIWAAGGTMTWRQNLSRLDGHGRPDDPAWHGERDVDYVPGCAMLVRREVFEDVGDLDAELFAYHEDVDFCLRARAAGWRVAYFGDLVCAHDAHLATGGGYNPRRKYMMGLNSVWFLRKHGTPSRWAGFVLFDVLPLPLLVLAGLVTGRARGAAAKGLGILHGLLGRRVRAAYLRAGASPLW